MLVYDTSYMAVCQGFLPNNCMFFAQNLPVFDKTCTIASLWNTFEYTLQKTYQRQPTLSTATFAQNLDKGVVLWYYDRS